MKLFVLVLVAAAALASGPPQMLPSSSGPYYIATGDLNGDGYPDVAIPCRGDLLSPRKSRPANDVLTVYLTKGSSHPVERRDFRVGFGPYTAAIGDLDGDGRADVVVANFQANDGRHLSILYGSGNRSSALEEAVSLSIEGGPFAYRNGLDKSGDPAYAAPGLTSVTLGDFNNDGKLDAAAVAWSSDFLVVLLNEGSRGHWKQARFPVPPGPRDLVAADFDGDGNLDLAITLYSSNQVQVWRGDGKGGFQAWQTFYSQGSTPYHLQTADLDGDRRPDLVVGNRGPSDNVAVFRNEPSGFRMIGSYSPGTESQGEMTADEIRDVLLTDWNGDGIPDLIAACHVSHKLVLWEGTGSAEYGKTFRAPETLTFPGRGPRSVKRLGKRLAVAFFDSGELGIVDVPGGSPGRAQ
ncbi:MAG: VCBS repeat-containing protein [Acidobacteria bacterium]|nr:VCBS repeat-containing protein [Acidobacteriota bacterium]